MAKRDYITEISAKRDRLRGRGLRAIQFDRRVDALIEAAVTLEETPNTKLPGKAELAKYLPIGWVACIEGYFRLVYRDLVDYGPPYRDNAATLKDVRIDLDHVVAMQAGKFTLGEFISHLLPVNDLDDINRAMSTLLGVDYLENLKRVKTDLLENDSSLDDLELSGALFGSVQYLFVQRHLFAHELNTRLKVRPKEIFHHSRAAPIMISYTEAMLEQHLGKRRKGR